ncbi:MAG: lipoyl(octanoyl) transferase LipB [Alphaproteobacteria bacterium]|nr:lipoyl(octanoyl) transferase LipB [Alphaproteobacteria bacterium]
MLLNKMINLNLNNPKVDIKISKDLVDYNVAVAFMEKRVEQIILGHENELIWFLEHPPLYTKGTSAKESDLLNPNLFPIYEANRGGQYTYHGPGQRIIYVMLNLKNHAQDVRRFVQFLENWVIQSFQKIGIDAFIVPNRIGVWVNTKEGTEAKIAAIGIRLRKWISYHGIAININPNLEHFNAIVPCGIKDYGVTSLVSLGHNFSMQAIDKMMIDTFYDLRVNT